MLSFYLLQSWGFSYGSGCYLFRRNAKTWDEAKSDCTSHGGQLVDITDRYKHLISLTYKHYMTNILVLKFIFLVSPLTYISVTFCSYEQAYLASILATERGAHWIGLTNRGRTDNTYVWTTGHSVSYTYWYTDFTGESY